MQLDSFKEKRVKTYLEKYGVDNPSKLPANREQAKRTTEENTETQIIEILNSRRKLMLKRQKLKGMQ